MSFSNDELDLYVMGAFDGDADALEKFPTSSCGFPGISGHPSPQLLAWPDMFTRGDLLRVRSRDMHFSCITRV